MPYCTLDDIIKLIPEESVLQLTDDEGLGMVDQDKIDEAIASADAEIDSYCGSRYHVPFAAAHTIIRKISVDIAIYNLYSRRLEEMPETRATRYKNAIRQLEGIVKGLISIGVVPAPPAIGEGGVSSNKDDRIFTKEKLEGY